MSVESMIANYWENKESSLNNNQAVSALKLANDAHDELGRFATKPESGDFKGSKVVDDEGKLLTVYHGTDKEFDEFQPVTHNAWTEALGVPTYFFTTNKAVASTYTTEGKGHVRSAHLDIKNPLVLDMHGGDWQDAISRACDEFIMYCGPKAKEFGEYKDKLSDKYREEENGDYDWDKLTPQEQADLHRLSKAAEKEQVALFQEARKTNADLPLYATKYDGIIVKNVMDMTANAPTDEAIGEGGSYNPFATVYVALKPSQIKLLDTKPKKDVKASLDVAIELGNPYHDAKGEFTSAGTATLEPESESFDLDEEHTKEDWNRHIVEEANENGYRQVDLKAIERLKPGSVNTGAGFIHPSGEMLSSGMREHAAIAGNYTGLEQAKALGFIRYNNGNFDIGREPTFNQFDQIEKLIEHDFDRYMKVKGGGGFTVACSVYSHGESKIVSKYFDYEDNPSTRQAEAFIRAAYEPGFNQWGKILSLANDAHDEKGKFAKKGELIPPQVDWKKYNALGVTENPKEAGFIRPNGDMVDLSKNGKMVTPGYRNMTHESAVGGSEPMRKLLSEGHIRYAPEDNSFQIGAEPTEEQYERIQHILESKRYSEECTIECARTLGELKMGRGVEISGEKQAPTPYYARPKDAEDCVYDKGVKPEKIIADIRRYYEGGKLDQNSLGNNFHSWSTDVAIELGNDNHDALGRFAPDAGGSFGSSESRRKKEVKTTEEALKVINDMPTTDDWTKAGFIRPDGELVNMNKGRSKSMDHADIFPRNPGRLTEVIAAGMLRINPDFQGVEIGKAPKAKQMEVLTGILKNMLATTGVTIEMHQFLGKLKHADDPEHSGYRLTGNEKRFNYPTHTKVAKIVEDIEKYYQRGRMTQEDHPTKKYESPFKDFLSMELPFELSNPNHDEKGKFASIAAIDRAKNFKAWFEGSKVVNDDGSPKVVYHGTSDEVHSFDPKLAKELGGFGGEGVFFSASPEVASGYAEQNQTLEDKQDVIEHEKAHAEYESYVDALANKTDTSAPYRGNPRLMWMNDLLDQKKISRDDYDKYFQLQDKSRDALNKTNDSVAKPNVLPVHLSIKNPLVVSCNGLPWDAVVPTHMQSVDRTKYDGIIFKDVKDSGDDAEYTTTTYVVFKPEQVKSATGNSGEYGKSHDIRASLKVPIELANENHDELGRFAINPDKLSKEVLNNMDKALKAKGFDSRGAEDVRSAMKERHMLDEHGQLWHNDWKDAYDKATGAVAKRKEKKLTDEEEKAKYPHIKWDRLKELGTTLNPKEAGYINPNGTLIDLSGRGDGGSGGRRELDHRVAGGTAGMQEAIAYGIIRYFPESDGIEVGKEPTDKQLKVIHDLVSKKHGEFIIDLHKGLGEFDPHTGYYNSPQGEENQFYQEYVHGTSPETIVNTIKQFYADKSKPKSDSNKITDSDRALLDELYEGVKPSETELLREQNKRKQASQQAELFKDAWKHNPNDDRGPGRLSLEVPIELNVGNPNHDEKGRFANKENSGNSWNDCVLGSLPVTKDSSRAGFIRPDGGLVDINRGTDQAKEHTEAAGGVAEFYDALHAGFIRYAPETGALEMYHEPTSKQYDQIRELAENRKGRFPAFVGKLKAEMWESMDADHKKAVDYQEWNNKASANTVINDIKLAYASRKNSIRQNNELHDLVRQFHDVAASLDIPIELGNDKHDALGRWATKDEEPEERIEPAAGQKELFEVGPREKKPDPNAEWESSGSLKQDIEDARDASDVKQALEHHDCEEIDFETKDVDPVWVDPEHENVVEVDKDGFASIKDSREWIYDQDPTDYFPDHEEQFNNDFWETPAPLLHATDEENVDDILAKGIKASDKTRGLSNRSVGAAVFTTPEWDEADAGSYGNSVFEIDTKQMKKDGFQPFVYQEPDVVEADLRERLASKIGLNDFNVDREAGMSESTVIIDSSIPKRYLKLLKRGGDVLETSLARAWELANDSHDAKGRFARKDGITGSVLDQRLVKEAKARGYSHVHLYNLVEANKCKTVEVNESFIHPSGTQIHVGLNHAITAGGMKGGQEALEEAGRLGFIRTTRGVFDIQKEPNDNQYISIARIASAVILNTQEPRLSYEIKTDKKYAYADIPIDRDKPEATVRRFVRDIRNVYDPDFKGWRDLALANDAHDEKGRFATKTIQGAEREKNFKDWFKDSKVRYWRGEWIPKRVYHGTPFEVHEFKQTHTGIHPTAELGTWFSDSPEYASRVAELKGDSVKEFGFVGIGDSRKPVDKKDIHPNVIPANLSLQNPKEFGLFSDLVDDMRVKDSITGNTLRFKKAEEYRNELIKKGYDGIYINTATSDFPDIASSHYVAFYPEQIKSVYNSGEYSHTPKIAASLDFDIELANSNHDEKGRFTSGQQSIKSGIGKAAEEKDGTHTPEFDNKFIAIHRGESVNNKGGKYWSTDPDFAQQFTQTGQAHEVMHAHIKRDDVYQPDKLPHATDENEMDKAIAEATKKGFKALRVDEGVGEPNSIFVLNKFALKSQHIKASVSASLDFDIELANPKHDAKGRFAKKDSSEEQSEKKSSINAKESVEVKPRNLTPAQLNEMDRALKGLGYDSRGGDDVYEQLTKGKMLRDGKLWHKDWVTAYKQAMEIDDANQTGRMAEYLKQRKANEEQQEQETTHINWESVNEHPLTDDPKCGGYMRPDGQYIDMSEGSGRRSEDHRMAGDTAGMQELIAQGYIRWMPEGDTFDIGKEPTEHQYKQIRKLVENAHGEVQVEVQPGLGEYDERNEAYRNHPRRSYREYDKGTDPDDVVRDIEKFYETDGSRPLGGRKKSYEASLDFKIAVGDIVLGNDKHDQLGRFAPKDSTNPIDVPQGGWATDKIPATVKIPGYHHVLDTDDNLPDSRQLRLWEDGVPALAYKLEAMSAKAIRHCDDLVEQGIKSGATVYVNTSYDELSEFEQLEACESWEKDHYEEYAEAEEKDWAQEVQDDTERDVKDDQGFASEQLKKFCEEHDIKLDANLSDDAWKDLITNTWSRDIEVEATSLHFSDEAGKSWEDMTKEERDDQSRERKEKWSNFDSDFKQKYNDAVSEESDKRVQEKLEEGLPEERISSVYEALGDAWHSTSEATKTQAATDCGVIDNGPKEIEEPDVYDPIGMEHDEDYKNTQVIARYLQIERQKELWDERGIIKTLEDAGRNPDHSNVERMIGDVAEETWGSWKNSSTSAIGLALQLATAQELGGFHRLNTSQLEDARSGAYSIGKLVLGGRGRNGVDNPEEIGMAVLKAHARATWEASQFCLAKGGVDRLNVYRGLMLAGDVVDKEKKETVSLDPTGIDHSLIRTKLPELKLLRNGAASGTADPSIANNWSGVGDNPPNAKRVVMRLDCPKEAILSIPAFGQNIYDEKEVVIAGTFYDAWDCWLKTAPSVEKVPFTKHAIAASRGTYRDSDTTYVDLNELEAGQPHWLAKDDAELSLDIPISLAGNPNHDEKGRFAKGPTTPEGKERWQLTQKEHVAERQRLIDNFRELYAKHSGGDKNAMDVPEVQDAYKAQADWSDVDMGHKPAVAQALREGKDVPDAVLADYPEIVARNAQNERLTLSKLPDWNAKAKPEAELLKSDPFKTDWQGAVPKRSRFGMIVIDPAENKILLRSPSNHFQNTVWTYCRGGAEKQPDGSYEHPLTCAKRECEEENGVEPKVLCPLPGVFRGDTDRASLYYVASHDSKEPLGKHDWETQETKWCSLDEARKLISTTGENETVRKRDLEVLDVVFGKKNIKASLDFDIELAGNPNHDQLGRFATGPDSKAFKDNFFGDWEKDPENASKVVDDSGRPQRCFHGTQRPDRIGHTFDPKRATSGPMAFFTTDPEVASGYAEGKADTSYEAPESYADWFKLRVGDKDYNVDDAWKAMSDEERASVTDKLPRICNTKDGEEIDGYRLGDKGEYGLCAKDHWERTIAEHRGNVLAAARDLWLDSGSIFGNEKEFADILKLAGVKARFEDPNPKYPSLYAVYLNIRKPLDTSAIPEHIMRDLELASKGKRALSNWGPDAWSKRTVSGKVWIDKLKADKKDGTTYAWTTIPDWVTKVLKSSGYDGIKDKGGKYAERGHTVWIPFSSEQVKSAIGNSGEYNTKNSKKKKDITASLLMPFELANSNHDEKGRFATKITSEAYGHPDYENEPGPLKVYHGSPSGRIKTFDMKQLGGNTGAATAGLGPFFTNDPQVAAGFAGKIKDDDSATTEAYLEIKNPKVFEADPSNRYGDSFEDLRDAIRDYDSDLGWNKNPQLTEETAKNYRESLKKQGYDGIVVKNTSIDAVENGHTMFVPFDTKQIHVVNGEKSLSLNFPIILANDDDVEPAGPVKLYQKREASRDSKSLTSIQERHLKVMANKLGKAAVKVSKARRSEKGIKKLAKDELRNCRETLSNAMLESYFKGHQKIAGKKIQIALTPRQTKRLKSRMDKYAKDILDKAHGTIRKRLDKHFEEDKALSPHKSAAVCKDAFRVAGLHPDNDYQLRSILRTGVNAAYTAGLRDAVNVDGTKNWGFRFVHTDGCDCPRCCILDGTTASIDHPVWDDICTPIHVNCLLPGQVASGNFMGGTKAWYEGQAVEIVLRSQRRVSMTPNHPVLTEKGFIAAGSLNEGDKCVTYDAKIESAIGASVASPYETHDEPTFIENVFEALRTRAQFDGTIIATGGLHDNFHGDGEFVKGKVEIVGTYGELIESLDAVIEQKFLNNSLVTFDSSLSSIFCSSTFNACRMNSGVGDWFVGDRDGSSGEESFTVALDKVVVTTSGGTFKPLSVGLSANWNIAITKHAKQNAESVMRFLSELFQRFSGDVSSNNFVDFGIGNDFKGFSPLTNSDARFNQSIQNSSGTTAFIDSQSRGGFPGVVAFDEIVEIRKFEYRGHVYDLQSLSGLIIADGICLSNCECKIIPVRKKHETVLPPEDELDDAGNEIGIGKSDDFIQGADKLGAFSLDIPIELNVGNPNHDELGRFASGPHLSPDIDSGSGTSPNSELDPNDPYDALTIAENKRKEENKKEAVVNYTPELHRGRKPDGAEESDNFGMIGGTVKLDDNATWRYNFRREYLSDNPKAVVTPEQIDGEYERQAVTAALGAAREFWSDNDIDAKWIRKQDDCAAEPIDAKAVKVSMNTIYTMNPKDYGAGSGGPGSAKVFWGPYSCPDRTERLTNENKYCSADQLGVDPMFVMGHELHHAFGYGSELDRASDITGVLAHMRDGLKHNPTAAVGKVFDYYLLLSADKKKYRTEAGRCIRYLDKKDPAMLEKLMTTVSHYGEPAFSKKEWQRVRKAALSAAKGQKPEWAT